MNTIYLSSIERQKNTYKGICGEVPQETDPDEVKKNPNLTPSII